MKISFIIPCYNTSTVIFKILDQIEALSNEKNFESYEVILVNDDSPNPSTLPLLKRVVSERDNITLINLAKNVGQPNAILAGCRYAQGDYIMTSDDDGQTQLNLLGKFIDKITQGYDVVCAKYTSRKKRSAFRSLGSLIDRIMSDVLISHPKHIYMSTIFLAKRFVIDEIIKYNQPYAYITGLILRVTQNIGNVEMEQLPREQGQSGYTLQKLLTLWLNGFTAFSIKPLRIADIIGCLFALGGFCLAIITIIRKLIYPEIQVGWSSLVAIILVVSGIILIMLGLIGEYIGRIYMCINGTPQSVIKEVFYSSQFD